MSKIFGSATASTSIENIMKYKSLNKLLIILLILLGLFQSYFSFKLAPTHSSNLTVDSLLAAVSLLYFLYFAFAAWFVKKHRFFGYVAVFATLFNRSLLRYLDSTWNDTKFLLVAYYILLLVAVLISLFLIKKFFYPTTLK